MDLGGTFNVLIKELKDLNTSLHMSSDLQIDSLRDLLLNWGP